MATSELDVALRVAAGDLPSPTQLHNSAYVALRVSGTGVAWRAAVGEFVYRDPAVWTSDEMRRRAIGLPVVVEHPPGAVMTSRFFGERVVGVVVHAFVRDDELWGVARIVDATAARMIAEGMFDTSPAVVLPGSLGSLGATLDVEGAPLVVEAAPEFLDHVALVYTRAGNSGVWTRADGSNGPGVITSSATASSAELAEPGEPREPLPSFTSPPRSPSSAADAGGRSPVESEENES